MIAPIDATGPEDVGRERARLIWLAVAVLGIALLIRWHRLLELPLWEDEGWTLRLVLAGSGSPLDVVRASIEDFWPPLHYLLLNLIGHFRETDVLGLRLPSVLFGAAACASLAYVAGRLTSSLPVAALAGGLLAVNVPHVLHSQEARVYPLLTFLAVWSVYALVRGLQGRPRPWLYVASTVALLYSHNFGVFLFGPQVAAALVVFVVARRSAASGFARSVLMHQAVVVALWLPLLLAFGLQAALHPVPQWATGSFDVGPLAWIELFAGLTIRTGTGAVVWALLGAGVVAVVAAVLRRVRAESATARNDLLLVVAVASVWALGVLATSAVLTAVGDLAAFGAHRYHMIAVPGLCLLGAIGIAAIPARALGWFLAGCVIVVLGATELPRHFDRFSRAPIDEVARAVSGLDSDGPILVGNYFRTFNFYLRGPAPRIGSEAWKLWIRQFEDVAGTVDGSSLRASTYGSEKMNRRIISLHTRHDPDAKGIAALERARARIESAAAPIVLVLSPNSARETAIKQAILSDPSLCPSPRESAWRHVVLVECGARYTNPDSRHGRGQ